MKNKYLAIASVLILLGVALAATVNKFEGWSFPEIELRPTAITIATNNDAGGPATYTLAAIDKSSYYVTCNDPQDCIMNTQEVQAHDGQIVTFAVAGTGTVTFKDTSGVRELAGDITLGQYDTLTMQYFTDRFLEIASSNN